MLRSFDYEGGLALIGIISLVFTSVFNYYGTSWLNKVTYRLAGIKMAKGTDEVRTRMIEHAYHISGLMNVTDSVTATI